MKRNLTSLCALALYILCSSESAQAGRLCQITSGANKDRVEYTNNSRCGNGKREVLATTQFFYGNGACGDLVIAQNSSFQDPGCQYRNITIQAGATLAVTSGSIMRCSGAFTNRGTIAVIPSASGGQITEFSSLAMVPAMQPAHPGNSTGSAGSGSIVISSTGTAAGGSRSQGNNGISTGYLAPATVGGGGGAAAYGVGGRGGGALTVLCKGLVNNVGTITAVGEAGTIGAGGGAGGVITLASQTRIVQTGTVSVVGGSGGDSRTLLNIGDGNLLAVSGGGGGGGGLIQMFAPELGLLGGANLVDGGAAGSVNDSAIGISNILVGGGAGGSAIAARGGAGGTINWANSHAIDSSAGAGDSGVVLSRTIDPASIF